MKQRFLAIATVLCALILSASASQSPTVQDQEKALDSVVIAPTDWDSLQDIEMLDDDCDPERKSDYCTNSLPKPKTIEEAIEEARGTRIVSACYNASKVLVAYKPCYPSLAQSARVSGSVEVIVVVDEAGNVTWARARKGNPLLRAASVRAACKWRFEAAVYGGEKRRVNRMIAFNFTEAK